jgi:predicted kinase
MKIQLEPKPTIAELEAVLEEKDVKVEILPNGQTVIHKTLICLVGLPRSGKSTWAKTTGHPIVSPDAIRLAVHGQRFIAEAEPFVWAIAKAMVRSLFLAGHHTVILDATNNTRKRRLEWISKDWETVFKVVDTPDFVCIERARAEGDEYIVDVIKRMSAEHEPLGEDETAL